MSQILATSPNKASIYPNMSIEDYHKADGLSSSGVHLMLDCPKRYWHEYLSGAEREDTKATLVGRALHMLVLEEELFSENFFPMDEEVNLTTKAGKEVYEKAKIDAMGRTIIRLKDWVDIKAMADSLKAHKLHGMLKSGEFEQSIFWRSGLYNTQLKARPDFYNDKYVIDLKTTKSIATFKRSIAQSGYHRQAAMQIDALMNLDGKKREFILFVVESSAPYLTAAFTLEDDFIAKGRRDYWDAAALYSDCKADGIWPGYDEYLECIAMPKYFADQDLLVAE